jgi:eukaryotic-like serine/threonine-protein kinase
LTPEQLQHVEEIYFRLREVAPEARGDLIDELCAGDPLVRGQVEALLGTALPQAFLATPALGGLLTGAAVDADPGQRDAMVGRMVGPWRIERLVGSGGMGSVYLAARADGAYEGFAAIKIVKRGMDTDEIVQRFRDERRTLANLKHPNIAGLMDAGSLPDGRPYLVMEYVAGLPMNDYCRENNLGVRERLALFTAVCRAVQFAHQNLVVHRDIKPGNIIITPEGAPKLLDFGIAKVLAAGGTSAPVTIMDERRLTPEYASPEQVEGRPMTTASDVYSLGVVLYELLTGKQPYRFQTRTAAEIQKIVASASPPPPSAAASGKHARELRGDLDNIVLMAMRKEPQRRYASAERLASDIDAYLRGFPVTARRDTVAYRTAKFVSRHRWAVSAAAAALLALAGGTATIAWQARIARQQRDEAFVARDQAEAIAKFIYDMLASGNPSSPNASLTVRQVLDRTASEIGVRLEGQPRVEAAVRSAIGTAYLGLGNYEEAEREIRAAYEKRVRLVGEGHHDTAESMIDLATVMYAKRELPEAERLLRRALEIFHSIRGEHNADVARTLTSLGAVLRAQGKLEEAGTALREAIQIQRSAGSGLDLAESLNNYAGVLMGEQKFEEAEGTMAEALKIRLQLLPPENPLVAQSTANLGVMIASQGDLDRAEPHFREALRLEEITLGKDHPEWADTANSLASVLWRKERYAEAEPLLREVIRVRRAALPAGDGRIAQPQIVLAGVLHKLGRTDDARVLVEEVAGPAHALPAGPVRTMILTRAAEFYDGISDPQSAAKHRDALRAGAP